ncbi:MAG TPA: hypothetical protein VE993_15060 [Stellaceae bacterium]|nr:hypothetical protein [Stellaceae bacterium]
MQLAETATMAYPRKLVEQIILGLSNPLNRHLVKLVGFDFPPEMRRHFQREVGTWLSEIQALRFKPNNRPGSFKFYFDLLFDYPFGGVEVRNMQGIMDLVAREYGGAHPTKSPEEMVAWLREFHTRLAERLHEGEDVLDLIPE